VCKKDTLTSVSSIREKTTPIKQAVLQNGGPYSIKHKPMIINKQIDTTGSKRKEVRKLGSNLSNIGKSNEDINYELKGHTQYTVEQKITDISAGTFEM
jgi:hypothetical protein